MKTKRLLFSLVLLLAFSTVHAQQVFKTTPASVIGYLEYLPKDYASNSDKYPVVIFLHGLGERGPNTTDKATLEAGIVSVTKLGPPKYVKNGTQFPFILISPQLKNNYGGWPNSYVMEVIDHVKTYLRIDEKRIHITGLSLGGGGTWTMAQDYATLFASAAPVCGSGNSTGKAGNIARENLPIWAFHGDADNTIPLSRSANMVNAINACSPVPNPKAVLSIYEGIKHNAWDRAYAIDHTWHKPNIYEWMMSYTNTINGGNRIPTANAGADVTTTASRLTLTGSGSDADGSIVSYQWTKISGPSVTLAGQTTSSLSLSNLTQGNYFFRLQVKDNGGLTDTDYVKVTVQSGAGNISPIVNAGPDISITLPTNTVTLTGTASDSDGVIESYTWTKVSGGNATLSGNTTSKLVASQLMAGSYTFRLTVRDNGGATKSDDVVVTVNEPKTESDGTNKPPVVNAGADRVLKLPGTSATIAATASDSDGIASFTWTQVSGPTVKLSNANTNKVKLSSFPGSAVCVFRLTVKDKKGASSYDDVQVTFSYPPTANAGADVNVSASTSTLTLTGTGKDQDGTIINYRWSRSSGPSVTLKGQTTPTLSLSNLVEGTYSFRFLVEDNTGLSAVDYVSVIVTGTKAAASSKAEVWDDALEVSEDEVIPFDNASEKYWTDKKVFVYDETGRELQRGQWSDERYQQLLAKRGLFIYRVVAVSGVKTGKIFITQ